NLNKLPRKIIKNYDDNKIPAIGLILFNEIGKNKIKINPWVWVKNTNTLIHETACGAGSVAAAYIFSKKKRKTKKKKQLMVVQPSGAIYKIYLGEKQIRLYGKITKI
ncbi:hypothetical protein KGQ24_02470, partial [Patescibacteria group bacterium]|nr:hypothetical protein [Patescibacteria group bacterium]